VSAAPVARADPRVQGSVARDSRSIWATCSRCGTEVDLRWAIYNHAFWCFGQEVREDAQAAFRRYYVRKDGEPV
jgi:hypothetical protein